MNWTGVCEMIQLLDYVHAHYTENIQIEDCAKLIGYSPRHCNLVFKKCMGETLGSYLRTLRMNAAAKALAEGRRVKDVCRELSFRSESGFRQAFKDFHGISPQDFLSGKRPVQRYCRQYEYRDTVTGLGWGNGANPTPDGLWKFEYYDTKTDTCHSMNWVDTMQPSQVREYSVLPYSGQFEAPYETEDPSDECWYCNHRFWGYGMHPAKTLQAVRTFLSPHDGTVEMNLSFGRICHMYKIDFPCTVQLFLNDSPLPSLPDPFVLSDTAPVHVKTTFSVKKSDRISLRLAASESVRCAGIIIYRQGINFTEIQNPEIQ